MWFVGHCCMQTTTKDRSRSRRAVDAPVSKVDHSRAFKARDGGCDVVDDDDLVGPRYETAPKRTRVGVCAARKVRDRTMWFRHSTSSR